MLVRQVKGLPLKLLAELSDKTYPVVGVNALKPHKDADEDTRRLCRSLLFFQLAEGGEPVSTHVAREVFLDAEPNARLIAYFPGADHGHSVRDVEGIAIRLNDDVDVSPYWPSTKLVNALTGDEVKESIS